MLKYSKILSEFDELFYCVRDSLGNIIYPVNEEELHLIELIKQEKVNEKNEIFCSFNNTWYEYSSKTILEDNKIYEIEYFKNITKFKENEKILKTDKTTTLANKQAIEEELDRFIKKLTPESNPFSIIMIDIDFFKNVNDSFGHVIGDQVLGKIGEILRTNITCKNVAKDIVGRFGGEEFIVILKNINLINTIKKAEQLRTQVENINLNCFGKNVDNITISLGIYNINPKEIDFNNDINSIRLNIIHKADLALYKSKENGRNQISVFNE